MKTKVSQNILPYIEAKRGMYIISASAARKRYVKVMDIRPIPFYTMSQRDQESVVSIYESWLQIAPRSWGVFATTTEADKEDTIDYILEATIEENNQKLIEERNKYIDWIRQISATESVARKVYLVFEYERDPDEGEKSEAEIAVSLENTAITIESALSGTGIRRIEHPQEETEILYEVLYKYFNRKSSLNTRYTDRRMMMLRDAQIIQNTDYPLVDPRNFYAPTLLDTRFKRYIVMDGSYYCFLYLSPTSDSPQVPIGWPDYFNAFGANVSVSCTFERMDKARIIQKTKQSNKFTEAAMANSGDRYEIAEKQGRISANDVIYDAIQNGEEIWKTAFLVSVRADSLKQLTVLRKKIEKELMQRGLRFRECQNHMLEALFMNTPTLYKDSMLADKAQQNWTSHAAASSFMFTDFTVDDPRGAIIAIDTASRLVSIDPFDTTTHANANGIVVGTTGSGKTFMMNSFLRHLRLMGTKIRLILPQKGRDDYYRTTESVNGVFISFGPGAKTCVNLFEIRPEDDADESLIYGSGYEHNSLLVKKIAEIKTWLSIRTRQTLTEDEMNELDTVLYEMYREFGITEDNSSVLRFKQSGKDYPIFTDLYNRLDQSELLKRASRAIKTFVDGACRNLNGQTNVDLNNGWVAFDVDQNVCGEMLPEYYFIAQSICVADAHRSKTEFVLIFDDEAQILTRNKEAARYIENQYSTLRAYGSGIWVATQEVGKLSVFNEAETSQTILSNADTKVLLKSELSQANYLKDQLDLTDAAARFITDAERGYGIILTGGSRIYAKFIASDEEFWLFNTDPMLAKAHMEELKAQERSALENE